MAVYSVRHTPLNALVVKRFYTPPTRKSWSKQHPDFRTRRPLVEPYNLGRLHPEKEWWRLPKKGLSPQTFMGFPDVEHLSKRGGSLYTHLMDGHTLTMVVYRSLDKNVEDISILRRLSMRALELAMSLDPYIVSLLFLYFSRSAYYDYRFVATFTGRILATLDQFQLLECSNVLLAMENRQFLHHQTRQRVLRHAEALCLTNANSIPAEDALRFISTLNEVSPEVDNIVMALGEVIEMADLETEEEGHMVDALYQCCSLKNHVDQLCVYKILDELCDRLERDKECKHSRNIAVLNAMGTFGYRRPLALELIKDGIKTKLHECNVVELCRYMESVSRLDYAFSNANLRYEALTSYDKLAEEPTLAIQYLQQCMKSPGTLETRELNLLAVVTKDLDALSQQSVLDLYEALSSRKAHIPDDLVPCVERAVKHAWKLLPQLTATDVCRLMKTQLTYESIIENDMLERVFQVVSENFGALSAYERILFIKFCARSQRLCKRLVPFLEHNLQLIPRTQEIGLVLLDLYDRVDPGTCTDVFQIMIEILTDRQAELSQAQRNSLKTIVARNRANNQATHKHI